MVAGLHDFTGLPLGVYWNLGRYLDAGWRFDDEVVDLLTFIPDERYEVIVASLYQMPVDPRGGLTGHRPVDFWGRNLLDYLSKLRQQLLEEDDVMIMYLLEVRGR